jgi:hypothetical protein
MTTISRLVLSEIVSHKVKSKLTRMDLTMPFNSTLRVVEMEGIFKLALALPVTKYLARVA